jgi:hypothetical protein
MRRIGRLVKKSKIVYAYDMDGNLLSERGLRRQAEYRYNGQNRTERSRYAYSGNGWLAMTQDEVMYLAGYVNITSNEDTTNVTDSANSAGADNAGKVTRVGSTDQKTAYFQGMRQ